MGWRRKRKCILFPLKADVAVHLGALGGASWPQDWGAGVEDGAVLKPFLELRAQGRPGPKELMGVGKAPPHPPPAPPDWYDRCGHAGTCRLAGQPVVQGLLGNVVPSRPGRGCPVPYPAVTAQEVGGGGGRGCSRCAAGKPGWGWGGGRGRAEGWEPCPAAVKTGHPLALADATRPAGRRGPRSNGVWSPVSKERGTELGSLCGMRHLPP